MFIKLKTNKTKSRLMRAASIVALIVMLPVTTIQASGCLPDPSVLFSNGSGPYPMLLTLNRGASNQVVRRSFTYGAIDNAGWHSPTNDQVYLTGEDYLGIINNWVTITLGTLPDTDTLEVGTLPITIITADLEAFNLDGGFNSCDDGKTFTLHDVTTDISALITGPSDTDAYIDAYTDLGTGISYGYVTVSDDDNGEYVKVTLNQDGINALNNAQAVGEITFGGTLENNTPPIADAGGSYLVAVGEDVSFDGSASFDPNGDTLTETWTADGGVVTGNEVIGYTYTAGSEPGIYEVTLVVSDGIDDSAPATTTVVVYDPSAGFVTGSGWIYSEQDADGVNILCKTEGDCTDIAHFSFVSRYKKEASIPTGDSQFNFQDGDLNFYSNVYEWLVAQDGGRAQYKGKGTNNGTGNYGFMLWAGDLEGGDTFRIKIWNKGDNDTVVYDNGIDQVIGGGQIKIHTKKQR